MRIQSAERFEPIATSQIEARCTFFGSLSQPKIQSAEEGRLEEEGEERLDRERRAEDVADEARVLGPVHPELELLHDPGDDAHREVDEEELAPELREALPEVSSPVTYHAVWRAATTQTRPRVRGTKKKW